MDEPFIIAWAPKDRDQNPVIYDAMHAVKDPEKQALLKEIMQRYDVNGMELKVQPVLEDDDPSSRYIMACVRAFTGNTHKFLTDVQGALGLNPDVNASLEDYTYTAVILGDYHEAGRFKERYDRTARLYGFEKIFDSRLGHIIRPVWGRPEDGQT